MRLYKSPQSVWSHVNHHVKSYEEPSHTGMGKIKENKEKNKEKLAIPCTAENAEELEISCTAGGNIKLFNLWKAFGNFFIH